MIIPDFEAFWEAGESVHSCANAYPDKTSVARTSDPG